MWDGVLFDNGLNRFTESEDTDGDVGPSSSLLSPHRKLKSSSITSVYFCSGPGSVDGNNGDCVTATVADCGSVTVTVVDGGCVTATVAGGSCGWRLRHCNSCRRQLRHCNSCWQRLRHCPRSSRERDCNGDGGWDGGGPRLDCGLWGCKKLLHNDQLILLHCLQGLHQQAHCCRFCKLFRIKKRKEV